MRDEMAAINAMSYRALRCLNNTTVLDKEVDKIENIIMNNNYEPKIVANIIQK